MRWFRKRLLTLAVAAALAATAAGQERTPPARAVSLGRPAPLATVATDPGTPAAGPRVIAESPPPAAAPHPDAAAVRQTSFSAPAARAARGLPEDEPRMLLVPRAVPPIAETSPPAAPAAPAPAPAAPAPVAVTPAPIPIPATPRPGPLRWRFRPVSALQPMLEPGKALPATPETGPDIRIYVEPTPPLTPAVPTTPAPAPTIPTAPPVVGGPVVTLPDGPLPDGIVTEPGAVLVGEPGVLDGGDFFQAPGTRFYVRGEYLFWWTRGFYLPQLVTTGPATVPEDQRGVIGAPGTQLLFGNTNTPSGPRSGARFTAGWFLDPCGVWAIEGSGFFLGRQSGSFNANSAQFPVLARPFFNLNTGMQDRELTATPGILPGDFFKLNGAIAVNDYSDLWGAEVNVRRQLWCGCNYNVSALAGFRYLDLREGLSITENVASLKAVPGTNLFDPGTMITVNDAFRTRNQFYGGQLGLSGEVRRGRFSVATTTKLGLGSTIQTVDVFGQQTFQSRALGVEHFTGGLLALPSNIGHHTREQMSFIPEVNLRLGYNLTPNLRVFVGYDFLYWTNVVRPGDQIDQTINSAQIPNFYIPPAVAPPSTAVRPVVPFRETGFWAQGINAGLEFRY